MNKNKDNKYLICHHDKKDLGRTKITLSQSEVWGDREGAKAVAHALEERGKRVTGIVEIRSHNKMRP